MQADTSPRRSEVQLSITVLSGSGTPADGGGPLHGGLLLLGQLTVDVTDPELEHDVRMIVTARDGWLACQSVTVTARPGGPPVTGMALRAPRIAAYVDQARAELADVGGAMGIVKPAGRGDGWASYDFASSPADWESLDFAQRRRAAQLTPGLVAACYREALADPAQRRRPTAAVAERLHVSRGHVSRLVSQARKQGLPGLGPGRPARRPRSQDR